MSAALSSRFHGGTGAVTAQPLAGRTTREARGKGETTMETPMDGTVGFAVLGPMEIRRGETGEAVTGRLRRTLLGVLLARPGGGVPADTLSDALWGERPDERAAARLQLHIHRLRAFLGDPDRLAFGVDGYRLRVAPGELDADRFETLIAEALRVRAREPGRAAVLLREALELWRGVPFAGLEVPLLDDWAHRLGERRLTAYEALYEAELACGNETAAVDGLSALVREHPLRERLHALLMTALYRAGRPADALAVYRTARERLVAELGLEPGPELRALERSVLAGEPIGRAARPGPSGAPAPPEAGRGYAAPAARPNWPSWTRCWPGRGTAARCWSPPWRAPRAWARPPWRCAGRTGYGTASPTASSMWTCTATARTGRWRPRTRWPGSCARSAWTAGPSPRSRPSGRHGTGRCWTAGGCWSSSTTRTAPNRYGRCCPAPPPPAR